MTFVITLTILQGGLSHPVPYFFHGSFRGRMGEKIRNSYIPSTFVFSFVATLGLVRP